MWAAETVEDIHEDRRLIEQPRKIKMASKKCFLEPYPECKSYNKNSCQKAFMIKVPKIAFTMMTVALSSHEPSKLFHLMS
jgi:hypothetical protein